MSAAVFVYFQKGSGTASDTQVARLSLSSRGARGRKEDSFHLQMYLYMLSKRRSKESVRVRNYFKKIKTNDATLDEQSDSVVDVDNVVQHSCRSEIW